jgi:hypothetical protein
MDGAQLYQVIRILAWNLVIQDYSYVENGSVSFEDSNMNHQTLQKWPQWKKQNKRIIYICTLYSLLQTPKHSTIISSHHTHLSSFKGTV